MTRSPPRAAIALGSLLCMLSCGRLGFDGVERADGSAADGGAADGGGADGAIADAHSGDRTEVGPQPRDDLVRTGVDTAISVLVLENDDAGLSLVDANDPAHGSVSRDGVAVRYEPNPGYYGVDSFAYTVRRADGSTAGAAVTVDVMTTHTWIGVSTGWSSPENWCGAVVGGACQGAAAGPGIDDRAVFDGTCRVDCNDASVDMPIDVAAIELAADFMGSVRVLRATAIAVGGGGFTHAGGDFIGGDAAFTVRGPLRITGGRFQATSGTMQLGSASCSHPPLTLEIGAAATFLHGNGTTRFVGGRPSGTSCNSREAITVAAGDVLHDVEVALTSSSQAGWASSVRAQRPLRIAGSLTLARGKVGGRWEIEGDLIGGAAPEDDLHAGSEGGELVMLGVGEQRYSQGAGRFPPLRIDKPSGRVEPASGTTRLEVQRLLIDRGDFVAPGRLVVGERSCYEETLLSVAAGTRVDLSATTVEMTFGRGRSSSCNVEHLIDLNAGTDLASLTLNGIGDSAGWRSALRAVTPIRVLGSFSLAVGRLQGAWQVGGLVQIGAGSIGGGGTLRLGGTARQTYTQEPGALPPGGTMRFENPEGVTLASDLTLTAAGQDLEIVGGLLDVGPHDVRVAGRLVLSDGATIDTTGGGSVSYGSCSATPPSVCP